MTQQWGENSEDNVAWEMEQKTARPVRNADPRDRLHARRNELTSWLAYADATTRLAGEAAWRAELAEIDAALQAAHVAALDAAGWDLATTTARRAEWNTFATTVLSRPGVNRGKLASEFEARHGWSMTALKAAIARHGLK